LINKRQQIITMIENRKKEADTQSRLVHHVQRLSRVNKRERAENPHELGRKKVKNAMCHGEAVLDDKIIEQGKTRWDWTR
jgi:hypothetical protein